MGKKALITGVNGQDGSYLAELLQAKQYEVHGLVRKDSKTNPHLSNVIFHEGDLTDKGGLFSVIEEVRPDEIYNLGALSSVRKSFDEPEKTANINALGALRLLEAVRVINPAIRFYQAGSSEMFGQPGTPPPYDENTPFQPMSPYAYSKVFAHHATRQYRDAYGLFACNGILFNHESPRRGEQFVTKKITSGVVRIKAGLQDKLVLGNLEARRDWGYAPEYVEAMWLMLQQDQPDDYVIATGEAHSIKDLVVVAFKCVGIENWQNFVQTDPQFLRSNDLDITVGNARKAEEKLGWKAKTNFATLIRIMVNSEISPNNQPA